MNSTSFPGTYRDRWINEGDFSKNTRSESSKVKNICYWINVLIKVREFNTCSGWFYFLKRMLHYLYINLTCFLLSFSDVSRQSLPSGLWFNCACCSGFSFVGKDFESKTKLSRDSLGGKRILSDVSP